jgi:hypothetical protein
LLLFISFIYFFFQFFSCFLAGFLIPFFGSSNFYIFFFF